MRARSITTALAGLSLLALVFAVACGGSSYSPAAPTPPAGGGGGGGTANATVQIVGMSFSPSSITVSVGQSVAWQNTDTITHTATADNGSFNTGNIAPGATSAPIAMSAAGSFTYHCQIHPNMVATVNVQ